MRWTLRTKLALGLAGILTAIMGLSLLLLTTRTRHRLLEDYRRFAIHISDVAEAGLEHAMECQKPAEIMTVLQAIDRREGIEGVIIFDKRGEIRYSVEAGDVGRVLSMDDLTCRLCHDRPLTDGPQTVIFASADGERILRVARPMLNQPRCQGCHQETVLGMLVTDFSLAEADRQVASMLGELILWALVTSVGVIAAAIGFVHLLVARPLGHFVKVTQAVGEGDLGRRVGLTGRDEIGELAASFDQMVQRVAARTRELEALNAVAATVSQSLDLEEILHGALEKVCEVNETEWGTIHLLDDQTDELVLAASCGLPTPVVEKLAQLKRGQSFAGWVAESGEPLVVEDPATDPRSVVRIEGLKSLAVVPLRAGGQVVGTLGTGSAIRHHLTPEEVSLLQAIGHQVGVAIENARLYEAERRRQEVAWALLEVAEITSSTMELIQLLKHIALRTAQVCRVNRCTIFLLDEVGEYLQPIMAQFADGHADAEQWRVFKATTADRVDAVLLFRRTVREGRPSVLEDPSRIDLIPLKWTQPFGIQKLLTVPLVRRERAIGLMALDYTDAAQEFTQEQVDLAMTIGSQVAASIENARLHEETKRLAITDGLTGLYNRRHFYQALEAELTRAARYEAQLSLIMLDIDDFKSYNDAHGHLAGDRLLQDLAHILTGLTRQVDTVARYGGEEFTVLLPETDKVGALALAERIRVAAESQLGPGLGLSPVEGLPGDAGITISAGVATHPLDATTAEELVHAADTALYQAKRAGKNKVSAF